ncbi:MULTISPECIES: DNA internalization-related competence protein ComEC/Rec2 [Bacillaceae]|uniref:DNA internalization-related competence protein ComEC/Rec2 n=1 Tax=Evansella alkalicola TaxID=745819 RepID=A0ABS6JVF2_9BACI|nr:MULTISPECIES: DNA internalization-related competence protein ComEC/Rec2 [Bacillaceae]MBU9722526.1 DNA internalization-related competence protein ComEC/Rec2 [Bacillus alkalicola]
MLKRLYCHVLIAIAALLLVFEGANVWFWMILCFGCIPLLTSIQSKKDCQQLLLGVLFFASFYFYGIHSFNETTLTGEETAFYGEVVSEPTLTTTFRISYQFQLISSGEIVQVFLDGNDEAPIFGDRCAVKGALQKPRSASNPHSFDYFEYLKRQGIHWVLQVTENKCESGGGSNIREKILHYRKKGIDTIMAFDNVETSALMAALVFGERSFIPKERIEGYRMLGVLHLLAVSGLHVGLITFAVFYLFCWIGLTREKAHLILFFMMPIYIILAGGAPSVTRASLMCMAFLFFGACRFKVSALTVLSIVGLGLLIHDPYILYHLGFQLSFITSFALLVSSRLLRGKNKMVILFKVTLIAQGISLPLSLFHFYELSILTLPVNLLFIPFISMWYLPMSFFTMILLIVFPPAANLTYFLAEHSLVIAHYMMDIMLELNGFTVVFGKPAPLIILGLFCSLFYFMYTIELRKRKLIFFAGGLFIFFLMLPLISPYLRQYAVLTMLDVGQGDAIVIELPRRKGVYLIDTGGIIHWGNDSANKRAGPGERTIEPFLKGNGIAKIDRLILTHGHLDHIGESCYISEKFRVVDVLYPISDSFSEEAVRLLGCVYQNSYSWNWGEAGDYWEDGDAAFYLINPTGEEKSENDLSIVIVAVIEGISILLTGDLEEPGERRIVREVPPISIDILKVGHHGSRTSSSPSFIDHWTPSFAIISAGRNNSFGHPHEEVLERFYERQIPVLRTDEHGAIQFVIKNGVYDVKIHLK